MQLAVARSRLSIGGPLLGQGKAQFPAAVLPVVLPAAEQWAGHAAADAAAAVAAAAVVAQPCAACKYTSPC